MDDLSYEPRKLPEIQRCAIWHPKSGLIVSPFTRTLPSRIDAPAAKFRTRNHYEPRLLEDPEIFWAFYPKRPIYNSTLFSTLALSPTEISHAIVHTRRAAGPAFTMESKLMKTWILLEDSLYEVIAYLMGHHRKRKSFPHIAWPRWPFLQGYRDSHGSYDLAYDCIKRSIFAFSVMSACATFALSLWLEPEEDTCFDVAFSLLANRPVSPMPIEWLRLLQASVVGNLEPGLRPGAFLNPYKTGWGQFMVQFCRAGTPVWFIWGHQYSDLAPADPAMARVYMPPPEYIQSAKSRAVDYESIVLPLQQTYYFEGTTNDTDIPPPQEPLPGFPAADPLPLQDGPDNLPENASNYQPWEAGPAPAPHVDRSLIVNAGSGQVCGETWEAFKARKEEDAKRRKGVESKDEKAGREAREENAKKNGPSKKSRVYTWEQDAVDPTVYRRTAVESGEEAFHEYLGTYEWGRFYWSYCNEWDLVQHLPPPPGVDKPEPYPNPDSDEDLDYQGISGSMPAPDPSLVQGMLDIVSSAAVYDDPNHHEYKPRFDSLKTYLKDRHGFHVGVEGEIWNITAHSSAPGDICLERKSHATAANILLYPDLRLLQRELDCVVDCYNTAVNPNITWDMLPKPWDITLEPTVVPNFIIDMRKVKLERVEANGGISYVLRPATGSSDTSPWFVVVSSATAVTEVYRKEWHTMQAIAVEFLARGIPFRTVIERDEPPPQPPAAQKQRGLGNRPAEYVFTALDYATYKRVRAGIFSSPRGRVLRMLGGIVGRLASEVVPDVSVLDGPSICDEVVLRWGGRYLVDDGISENTLDLVSGVYHVLQDVGSSQVKHMSYWPKHSAWTASGLWGDQWSPAAEAFYQRQTSGLLTELSPAMKGHTQWKGKVRGYHKKTKTFFKGSERLADEFIRKSERVY